MNVSQALEHASALFIPEIVYCEGFPAMDSERQKNEEAMAALREEFAKNDNPSFSYDVIRGPQPRALRPDGHRAPRQHARPQPRPRHER